MMDCGGEEEKCFFATRISEVFFLGISMREKVMLKTRSGTRNFSATGNDKSRVQIEVERKVSWPYFCCVVRNNLYQ